MSTCLLVDTCALLWATGDTKRLSKTARAHLEDETNRILVSHATIWELSIKLTVGKLTLPGDYFERLPSLGYEILTIRDEHFAAYRDLPLLHRDPFDRLLIAQAQVEEVSLLSADPEIATYEVGCVW